MTNLTLRLIVNLMFSHQKNMEEKKEESNAKIQLWKSLTKSLKSKMLEKHASELKSDNVLAEKANLFGKVVADTRLQYENIE